MKDAKHYKVCTCSEAMSAERLCCTKCGKSSLDNPSTGKKVKESLEESSSPLPFLSEAQNRKRARIEADIKQKGFSKRLMEAYQAMGLTERESLIASSVECRLLQEDLDFLNIK